MIRLNPEVLDTAREQRGFTSDEQLAAALGLSVGTIRNLRAGRTSPSLHTVIKIARLAGVPVEGLLITTTDRRPAAA